MSIDSNAYHAAVTHYQHGRFLDALHTLGANPDDTESLNLAAICCFQLHRFEDAETFWRRALTRDPAYAAGYANLGNLLMARGDLSGAEAVYRQAIEARPDHATAHYNLGNLLDKLDRPDEAESALRRAVACKPDFAEAYYNLGNLLRARNRPEEAEGALRAAVLHRADYADAWINLGNLLRDAGRLADASRALRRAVALRPDSAEAHLNLGHVLSDHGRQARAAASYRRAGRLDPGNALVWCCLGRAMVALNRTGEAETAFRAAISADPDCADAHIGLAGVFEHEGGFADAVRHYRQALIVQPGNAHFHGALANALHRLGQLHEAEAACRNALSIDPAFAEVHYNLGLMLSEQDRLTEAETHYRRAIAIKPDYAAAHTNLGRVLRDLHRLPEAEAMLRESIRLCDDAAQAHNNLAGVLKDMSRMDEALDSFRRAVECDPDSELTHRNLNYSLTYHAEDPREILDECVRFATRHEAPFLAQTVRYPNDRNPARRLRIGYVAPDFNGHCQSMFTAPVFASHDRAMVELYVYSSVTRADQTTVRLRASADIWRDVQHLSDEQLAAQIRDDRIDVLIDLTLHMSRGRPLLFARRPAPVQVQWLGYPGTTGSRAIRYRLSDPWIDPPDQPETEAFYSERTIRLPDTFWCVDLRVTSPNPPDVGALPATSNGFVTFGCLNNPCKASARTLRMWARVLAAVPDARFVLLAGEGPREHFSARLGALGVDMSRVSFIGYQERDVYLQTWNSIDIGLDTFPYNGHTTTLDALWMGVPVPSRAGATAVSRAGLSLLSNLDLADLVAYDDDAYVEIVTNLAHDLARLAELRASLRGRLEASPMMDAPRFTRDLERAYRQMWQAWCADSSD
jgi:protein O-GlcNAc transferase